MSDLEDTRIVPCGSCQTEGLIIRDAGYNRYGEPQEIDDGPCPYCEGTGGEMIEAELLEDIDVLSEAEGWWEGVMDFASEWE